MSQEEVQRQIEEAKTELRALAKSCGVSDEELEDALTFYSSVRYLKVPGIIYKN